MTDALPVDRALPEALAALGKHGRIVLTAPPGSGKTTRVPPALVDAGVHGQVVVLEPRRVAARAAARRVAQERGTAVGAEVGFQVRHEKRVGADTRIVFATEGILVRRLCRDPFLEGVGAVVLDEFHERHVETDLALAMLAEVRETVRDDLAIVVMSATLDAEPIADFLGGAPIVAAEGEMHPVETVHVHDAPSRPLAERVRDAVKRALDETPGDVLVFLPGVGEIAASGRALAPAAERAGLDVLPLHGSLTGEQQDRVLQPAGRKRRVVLATNIAESSLTIDGVTAVVDSGLARVLRHDPGRALDTLRVERISRASAAQRAGRAGRTAPGTCYRLWSVAEERAMAAFDTPEIRRTDLAGPALIVHAFAGRGAEGFSWFDPPERSALARADELLRRLGALDAGGAITDTGRAMLAEPVHPRLARMLVEAGRLHCRRAAAEIAALLSERELSRPGESFGASLHEHLARLHAVERDRFAAHTAAAHGVDARAARAVARVRDQLARGGSREDHDESKLARAVLEGFPDRVARRPDPGRPEGVMVGGRGLRWDGAGAGDDAELHVALRVSDTGGPRARLSLSMPIERADLEAASVDALTMDERAELDSRRGQVVAVRTTRWFDLVLEERRGGVAPDATAVRSMLEAAVRADPAQHFADGDDVESLVARTRWLRAQDDGGDVPDVRDEDVADAAAAMCAGRRSLSELAKLRLVPTLTATWTGAQRAALDERAPSHVTLPTGRRARIDYTSGEDPFVAVRMQEVFGMLATPRLAGGRVPLLLHLLAPNHRPVQITRDLQSFWDNVWPKVRSELRRRYPKHAWPENPRTAPAERRPRRRR